MLRPASDAIRAGLGAPLPEQAPRGVGDAAGERRGAAVTEVQRPGTSVPWRSSQWQIGLRLPALPAREHEEAPCRWLGSPLSHRCEGTRDLSLGCPPHRTMPASPANLLKCGGSFFGSLSSCLAKRIFNSLFKGDQAQRESSSAAKELGRARQHYLCDSISIWMAPALATFLDSVSL